MQLTGYGYSHMLAKRLIFRLTIIKGLTKRVTTNIAILELEQDEYDPKQEYDIGDSLLFKNNKNGVQTPTSNKQLQS